MLAGATCSIRSCHQCIDRYCFDRQKSRLILDLHRCYQLQGGSDDDDDLEEFVLPTPDYRRQIMTEGDSTSVVAPFHY